MERRSRRLRLKGCRSCTLKSCSYCCGSFPCNVVMCIEVFMVAGMKTIQKKLRLSCCNDNIYSAHQENIYRMKYTTIQ